MRCGSVMSSAGRRERERVVGSSSRVLSVRPASPSAPPRVRRERERRRLVTVPSSSSSRSIGARLERLAPAAAPRGASTSTGGAKNSSEVVDSGLSSGKAGAAGAAGSAGISTAARVSSAGVSSVTGASSTAAGVLASAAAASGAAAAASLTASASTGAALGSVIDSASGPPSNPGSLCAACSLAFLGARDANSRVRFLVVFSLSSLTIAGALLDRTGRARTGNLGRGTLPPPNSSVVVGRAPGIECCAGRRWRCRPCHGRGTAAPRALSRRWGWGNWLFPAVAAIGAAILVWFVAQEALLSVIASAAGDDWCSLSHGLANSGRSAPSSHARAAG